jgi:uncharacterized protein YcfJ
MKRRFTPSADRCIVVHRRCAKSPVWTGFGPHSGVAHAVRVWHTGCAYLDQSADRRAERVVRRALPYAERFNSHGVAGARMGRERCTFTLAGAVIGALVGVVAGYAVGGADGGHVGAMTGVAVGAPLGYWLITVIASS